MNRRIALVTMSCLVSVGLAEAAVRSLKPQLVYREARRLSPGFWQRSDVLPAELKPNYDAVIHHQETNTPVPIHINSRGLRSPEFDVPKPRGVFRVLVLGDSFAFNAAMPDEQVYTRRLEQALNASALGQHHRFEVINCGYADGYSPDSYIAFMQQRGFAFEPDLLLMQYFIRNDFVELLETKTTQWREDLPYAVRSTARRVDDDGVLRRTYTDLKYRVPLLRDSHLFVALYELLHVDGLLRRVAWMTIPHAKAYRFEPSRLGASSYCDIYRQPLPEALQSVFRRSIDLVIGLDGLCRRQGVPLVVFLVPTGAQVDRTAWARSVGQQLPFPEAPEDVAPQRAIAEALTTAGVTVVNPLAAYRQAAQHTVLYLGADRDGHWTAEGNAVTANILFEVFSQTVSRVL